MHRSLNAQTSLYQPLKLFIADVRLPKTSWKVVPQPWANSQETSAPKVAISPSDDTSP